MGNLTLTKIVASILLFAAGSAVVTKALDLISAPSDISFYEGIGLLSITILIGGVIIIKLFKVR